LYFGVALKGEGVKELLEGVIEFIPAPLDRDSMPLSALVYKISHHKTLGKLAHIKLFSGELQSRYEVFNITKEVTQVRTEYVKLKY
jgi:ribosomal protection tetracycline resistance protein